MPESSRTAFGEVDRTGDPGGFVRYLDTTRATAFFREVKERSYAALDLRPSLRALDVGCGTGEDAQALARAVGPGGLAVGVDVSATMLAEARRRAAAAGLPVAFCRADAQRLPFADDAFDRCRAERVLQHVEDPRAVLAELIRVTRPGGLVAIWESELEMLVLDVPDRAVGRRLEHAICDGFRNGAIGHRLYRFFKEAGLVEVEATPLSRAITDYALADAAFQFRAVAERAVAAGSVTADEAAAWLASLEAARDAGHFLCAVAGFLVSGRKP
ncbi:MAG TPA: methyltransferase domain-containing protein [Thermomicrobiales bacterium]|nr:methyltransferase domain-containing protein [Thermomicrobiales bacterium]